MTPGDGSASQAAAAWRRAGAARARAVRADEAAERHERWAADSSRELHQELADALRASAGCHRSSARLQEAFAQRVEGWTKEHGARPQFMTGVAEACGTNSVALTLVGADQSQLAVAASNPAARAAQDLEFMLGEGPTKDATRDNGLVFATSETAEERWPCYGPALAALGIREVAAIPLESTARCFGALAVFDPRPGLIGTSAFLEIVAGLAHTVLLGPELYGGTDHRDVVQQAAGMVSVQADCRVNDALALIKARAFSRGESVGGACFEDRVR
ncbi:GAF domain-containing protein [Streptomyces sp. PmtG]